MIKSITEIIKEIQNGVIYDGLDNNDCENILKSWADSIVERCASELSDDGEIQEGWLYNNILKIKEQIK